MEKKYLGIDVGGSHITIGEVIQKEVGLTTRHKIDVNIDSAREFEYLVNFLVEQIERFLSDGPVEGIGFSMPGPMVYERGIAAIYDLHKYDHLFGSDIRQILLNRLTGISKNTPITFINDGQAFLLGGVSDNNWIENKAMGVTVGTGLGSAFSDNGQIIEGESVPNGGFLYPMPYKNGVAEDFISGKWIVNRYYELTGKKLNEVKEIAGMEDSSQVFHEFGEHLAGVLSPVIQSFQPEKIVFGGNIFKAYHLFEKSFFKNLQHGKGIEYKVAPDTSAQAIKGAVAYNIEKNNRLITKEKFRNSSQYLLPMEKSQEQREGYDVFPTFPVGGKKIFQGFEKLADWIGRQNNVIIDGMSGVQWENFVFNLNGIFREKAIKINWFCIDTALKDEGTINEMVKKYTREGDPVFGFIYPGEIGDFFDADLLKRIQSGSDGVNILYGTGAALAGWSGPLIWLDVPKNEIQYRSRVGKVNCLGRKEAEPPKQQYKRLYYIDWVVLKKHKENILKNISILVDEQRRDGITWMEGSNFQNSLDLLTQNTFRVRPWFEPGAWGGTWIKENIEGVNPDVPNYAWSFECITPENGIILESSRNMLEFGFDFLMAYDPQAVLGNPAERFGKEFPIRFDFLDTFDGGNLSLQCHPRNEYIQENFGESFTQDETYYILDARDDATVYLGFQEDVDKNQFRKALENSEQNHEEVPVTDFVQKFPSKKHDLFLIPNGTVHCSGVNNMVLEISSTPYIYTFKMYDWLRLDLDGQPRPLNIQRALDNLNFDRKGKTVEKSLISKSEIIDSGESWQIVHLPTHVEHFYDIHRIEWEDELVINNANGFHVLNLVEGEKIEVITGDRSYSIRYAETFLVPAGASGYRVINKGSRKARLVKAFMK